MKRWLHLLACLYPARWRRRYGPEFDALLEDADPRWSDLWDVTEGAIAMQLRERKTMLAATALAGVLGAAAAFAVALMIPNWYVSTAVVQSAPAAWDTLNEKLQASLNREALVEAIQTNKLYRDQSLRLPLEELVEMLRRSLTVQLKSGNAIVLQFSHDDPAQAQQVVRQLSDRIAASLEGRILDSASLPRKAMGPRRPVITGAGFTAGCLAGMLAFAAVARLKHASSPQA